MIKCLDSGDLYCSKCGRLCDSTCWNHCENYIGMCSTCKHKEDKSDYCNDCDWIDFHKWEDKYVHNGKF